MFLLNLLPSISVAFDLKGIECFKNDTFQYECTPAHTYRNCRLDFFVLLSPLMKFFIPLLANAFFIFFSREVFFFFFLKFYVLFYNVTIYVFIFIHLHWRQFSWKIFISMMQQGRTRTVIFFCNSIAMTVPFTLGLVLLCMVSQILYALQSILTFFSSFSFKKYVNFLLLEKTLFMNYKEISSAILLIQLMFGPFNWALSCSFRLHTSK